MICPQLFTSTSAQLLNQEYNINNKNAIKSTKKNPKNCQKIAKKTKNNNRNRNKNKNKKQKLQSIYVRSIFHDCIA